MSGAVLMAVVVGFGILSGALILAGGIVCFVVGRGRAALPGAGFVVLAVGTIIGSVLPLLSSMFDTDISPRVFSATYTIVQGVFDLIGWGLIILTVLAAARSGTAAGPQPFSPYGRTPSGYRPSPGPPPSGRGPAPYGPPGPPPPR
jgi:hypothetical protein